jgi:hypothetical protein
MIAVAAVCAFGLFANHAAATSNHEYGPDEYVTIAQGISPDGKYAITAHGEGDLGYDRFHIYLMDASAGRKIGPLEEITDTLDTGADAFCAQWSRDSQFVTIVYRVDRHAPLKAVSYRIGKGRAFPMKGPVNATGEQTAYWGSQCSSPQPPGRVFGSGKAQ